MSNTLIIFLASILGNASITVWMLQIKDTSSDPTSLLIAAVTGLVAALITVFFIYRKEIKERNASNEQHAKNIEAIYQKVVAETNTNITNNNRLTHENSTQVKELREVIQRLPKELREALKDKP